MFWFKVIIKLTFAPEHRLFQNTCNAVASSLAGGQRPTEYQTKENMHVRIKAETVFAEGKPVTRSSLTPVRPSSLGTVLTVPDGATPKVWHLASL